MTGIPRGLAALLPILAALWHLRVPVPTAALAVPMPAVIAAAELAALAGLAALAFPAVRGFRSAPWPRSALPATSGGAA